MARGVAAETDAVVGAYLRRERLPPAIEVERAALPIWVIMLARRAGVEEAPRRATIPRPSRLSPDGIGLRDS